MEDRNNQTIFPPINSNKSLVFQQQSYNNEWHLALKSFSWNTVFELFLYFHHFRWVVFSPVRRLVHGAFSFVCLTFKFGPVRTRLYWFPSIAPSFAKEIQEKIGSWRFWYFSRACRAQAGVLITVKVGKGKVKESRTFILNQPHLKGICRPVKRTLKFQRFQPQNPWLSHFLTPRSPHLEQSHLRSLLSLLSEEKLKTFVFSEYFS